MMTLDPNATVLIVDDNAANLSLLIDQLLASGYHLTVAESGESALERVRYRKPDIILLDIRMPGIDGFETCRRLKADGDSADIPVIFLSAHSDADDKARGFEVGGADYIAKPLDITEVLLRIRTHLALRQLQQQLQHSNQELERRVTARTAELKAEVERRTRSESEKVMLLDLVRTQGQHLQLMTNQALEMQLRQRTLLSEELDAQVAENLNLLAFHLNALDEQAIAADARSHVEAMARLLKQTQHFIEQVTRKLQQPPGEEMMLKANPLLKLSNRESEVLMLLVNQHSTDDISRMLHITGSTVRTYRQRIMQKLELTDTVDLLRFALKNSLTNIG